MLNIYISSTYFDLKDYREAVYRALSRMGHHVVAMEDYVASDQRPLDKCLADVAQCNVYVGIFAWRYGYVPPDQDKSITELEFREAVRRGKSCLIFLVREDAPWPRSAMDRDSQKIEGLRKELLRDYMTSDFSEPDELATLVGVAVANLQSTSAPKKEETADPAGITVRVYNFENHTSKASAEKIGERFPGILLNQLLRLQLGVKKSEEDILPMNIWGFRTRPPEDLVESFRNLAPYVVISGYIEDADETGKFLASIRVTFIDKKLRDEVLIVEEVEFSNNRKSMVSALGDMAPRILQETKKLGVRINLLLEKLGSPVQAEVQQAQAELVELGPVRQLCEYLNTLDEAGKINQALELLGSINDPSAAPALRPLLEHRDEEVKRRAALLLGKFGDRSATPLLLELAERNYDSASSIPVINIISGLMDERAVRVMTKCLDSSVTEVREAAMLALSGLQKKELIPIFSRGLKDGSTHVRRIALSALRGFRDPELIPIFKTLLSAGDELNGEAAQALAEVGDSSGAQLLLEYVRGATSTDSFGPERLAVSLLKGVKDRSILPELVQILHEGNKYARGYAADILGAIGDESVLTDLGRAAEDKEYFPRYMAIKAIGQIGHPLCAPILLRAFKDEHVNCREEAFKGYLRIGRFSDEDADLVEALIKSERDTRFNFYGLWILAQKGRKQALLKLADLLTQDSFLLIEDLLGGGYLDDDQVLEKLKPLIALDALTPPAEQSSVQISTPKDWGKWVREHQEGLTWDDKRKMFKV